jgi:hypothetical protein
MLQLLVLVLALALLPELPQTDVDPCKKKGKERKKISNPLVLDLVPRWIFLPTTTFFPSFHLKIKKKPEILFGVICAPYDWKLAK